MPRRHRQKSRSSSSCESGSHFGNRRRGRLWRRSKMAVRSGQRRGRAIHLLLESMALRGTKMLKSFLALAFLTLPAAARDNGQWGNEPTYVREWFQGLMQPDNKYLSCCGEADAFEADSFEVSGDQYVAIITNGKGM